MRLTISLWLLYLQPQAAGLTTKVDSISSVPQYAGSRIALLFACSQLSSRICDLVEDLLPVGSALLTSIYLAFLQERILTLSASVRNMLPGRSTFSATQSTACSSS